MDEGCLLGAELISAAKHVHVHVHPMDHDCNTQMKYVGVRRWTDGGLEEVVRIRDLHEGTEEMVPKVESGAD